MDTSQIAFYTEIKAYKNNGEIGLFQGPVVHAVSWGMADKWCQKHMPYLLVKGKMNSQQSIENKSDVTYYNIREN